MRISKPQKLDPLAFLVILVSLGMLVTSVVHAEDYLFSNPLALDTTLHSPSSYSDPVAKVIPESRHSWLVPGAKGLRTTIKGGMAHIQFDSQDEGAYSSWLPQQTRFIFSMGLEESIHSNGLKSTSASDEVFDRYVPRLYLSIGHRW